MFVVVRIEPIQASEKVIVRGIKSQQLGQIEQSEPLEPVGSKSPPVLGPPPDEPDPHEPSEPCTHAEKLNRTVTEKVVSHPRYTGADGHSDEKKLQPHEPDPEPLPEQQLQLG